MFEICRRAKSEGGKCGSPALKGKSFCYNHDPRRLRAARAVKIRYFLEVPAIGTSRSDPGRDHRSDQGARLEGNRQRVRRTSALRPAISPRPENSWERRL